MNLSGIFHRRNIWNITTTGRDIIYMTMLWKDLISKYKATRINGSKNMKNFAPIFATIGFAVSAIVVSSIDKANFDTKYYNPNTFVDLINTMPKLDRVHIARLGDADAGEKLAI